MEIFNGLDGLRERAEETLRQLDTLAELAELDIPGRFVFAPPESNRLVVKTLAELHEARTVLRREFGWQDVLNNKFASQGCVIVTYRPLDTVALPVPFELWVDAPVDSFPPELLDGCRVVAHQTTEYSVVCPA